ncbi:unnamed protein product [Bathycoccus prasinos]
MLFARVDEEELLEESDSEVSEMDHGRGGRKRVLEAFRRRGFGTALVSRWIKEFAIDAKAFAVDMPNGKMLKLLKHARCEVAVEKSGFEAGTLHFLNLPI